MRTAVAVLLGGSTAACSPAVVATPEPVPQPSAACIVVDTGAPALLRVAVGQSVDAAHAPAPRNAAERLVFRQLYETLVRVDCEGVVQPGLAEWWSADTTGRQWQFRLRAGARFADGSPVTPAAVAASWADDQASEARTTAGVISIADAGGGVLDIELATAAPAHAFADAGLAVARRASDSDWPAGTTGYRVDTATEGRVTRLVADAAANMPRALEFHVSADPRAALDAGTDLLVTSDAAALAYTRALADYSATPLPWDHTYVLVTRRPGSTDDVSAPTPAALDALATSALRSDARAAEPPIWWHDPACIPSQVAAFPRPGIVPAVGAGAFVHARDDAAARAITERLVALAWPAANAPAWLRDRLPADFATGRALPTALGLDPQALHGSLHAALRADTGAALPRQPRDDAPLAFVISLPRPPAGRCTVPFGTDVSARVELLSGARDWRVTPLVDTRARLIRRGAAGRVVVDGDGTLVFAPAMP